MCSSCFSCILDFLLTNYLLIQANSDAVSKSSVGQGWLHVYLDKNAVIFCLFTLRRSRTETASSHGCLASEFVCQHVSPCDRVKHVCSRAWYICGNNLGNIFLVVNCISTRSHVCCFCLFFTLLICTLSLIHRRRVDWLTAVWVQRDTVFISLAFRVCLWSVSCWLRVNMQHLITSLGLKVTNDLCITVRAGLLCFFKAEYKTFRAVNSVWSLK